MNLSLRPVAAATLLAIPLLVLTPANPAAAGDPCVYYHDLERGQGPAELQRWHNHLDARGYARWHIACAHKWGTTQWQCLDRLWSHESGWNHRIWNQGGSGAYGIPQALPGYKMASHGDDWRTNPRVQVRWGTDYIADRYGVPTRTGCRGPY